jgi:cytoskeletal protein CcmA (bactofilin family)
VIIALFAITASALLSTTAAHIGSQTTGQHRRLSHYMPAEEMQDNALLHTAGPVHRFEPNILWTKAITAEGDLILTEAKVYGNIFAVGDIIASGDSIIHGETVTEKRLMLGGDNTALTINGNVYAHSIINDKLNGKIMVNSDASKKALTSYSFNSGYGGEQPVGDVVLKGSLELRADGEIIIGGHFTGFTDVEEEASSCIIVDTEGGKIQTNKDTIISGSREVTLTSSILRTGESIALKDNYRILSDRLTDLNTIDYMSHRNYLTDFVWAFWNNKNEAFPFYVEDYLMTFRVLESGINEPVMYADTALNIFDKADYFYYLAQMQKDSLLGSGLLKNSNGRVDILANNDNNYELSANGVVFAGADYIGKSSTSARTAEKRSNAIKVYLLQLKSFGDMSGADTAVLTQETLPLMIADMFDFNRISARNSVEHFDGWTERYAVITDGSALNIGPGRFKGIIITNGRVYIEAQTEFHGVIISEGDVIIGYNSKVYNDRDVIAKAMYKYPEIYSAFKTKESVMPSFVSAGNNLVTSEHFSYIGD